MPNTQGNLNLLFRLGLRKNFRDEWKEHSPQWNQVLKQGTVDSPEISASIFTAFARLYELGDGEAVTFETVKQGPKVAAVDREFGVACAITQRTWDDDKYGKTKQAGKWLAHANRMTYEYLAAGFWDDAFATSNALFPGIDNKAICVSTHTFLNAPGTWSNITANPVGFSMAGVNAMLDIFMTMKDHNGDPVVMMPDKWIIGNNSGDVNRFIEIFGSEKDPTSANNAVNAVRERLGSRPTKIVSVYKTSTKSYFAIDSSYFDAHFLIRKPAVMEDWRDPATGTRNSKLTTRVLIWQVDGARGVAGANPS